MLVDNIVSLKKGDDIITQVKSGQKTWYNLYTDFDGRSSFASVKIYPSREAAEANRV